MEENQLPQVSHCYRRYRIHLTLLVQCRHESEERGASTSLLTIQLPALPHHLTHERILSNVT
ncbi:hypothetical protein BDP27DRAFT_1047109 [Rhodocollybia butyracea]|uniref:Uncharacterized protein n=1 Tax=Rhodocollybia butyracea TaxID=206335 RepID=A0A9P5U4R5_9AGAR|nr:hypothetical protein BDP27DRAFT_1047109 [Rhodocollybia butyracea]